MAVGRPRGSVKTINFTPEIVDELLALWARDYTDEQLAKHLQDKYNIKATRGGMRKWRHDRLVERKEIVVQNTDILKKIDIGSEIDELVRFKNWLGGTIMEIFENIPKKDLYDPKVLVKFIEAYQKSHGQIFALHGLDLTVKQQANSDELSKNINEKLERLVKDAPKEIPKQEIEVITNPTDEDEDS